MTTPEMIAELADLRARVARIMGWHSQVGGFCEECETRWPCDTHRMADGSYIDPDDDSTPTSDGDRDEPTPTPR